MPTGVRKITKGKNKGKCVAYDKRTGKTLTKPTSCKNAGIFASKRDKDVKKK